MFIVRNLRNTENLKEKMKTFRHATKMQPRRLFSWDFLAVRTPSLPRAPFPRFRRRFSRPRAGLFLVGHLRGPRRPQPQQADAVLSAPAGVQISRETFSPCVSGGLLCARSTQLLVVLRVICGAAFRKHPTWGHYLITAVA